MSSATHSYIDMCCAYGQQRALGTQTVQYLWAHQMQLFAAIFFFFSFLMPQVKLVLSGLLWFHPSMWDDRCVRPVALLTASESI